MKEKNEDQILMLLYLAETNLNCSYRISQYIKKNINTKFLSLKTTRFLILSMNNNFYETVSILNTLLFPYKTDKQKKKEISFELLNLSAELKKKMQYAKQKFSGYHFINMRNNFIGHKNADRIPNPELYGIAPVDSKHFFGLFEIIKDLKEVVFHPSGFSSPTFNNFLNDAEEGIEKILYTL